MRTAAITDGPRRNWSRADSRYMRSTSTGAVSRTASDSTLRRLAITSTTLTRSYRSLVRANLACRSSCLVTAPAVSCHVSTHSSDKTLKLYEGHYHDLLNDLGKEQVMADIRRWISDRLPTA